MAEAAIAVYACIAYMISVITLVLQGVGEGSQPLISKYYGAGSFKQLWSIRSLSLRIFPAAIGRWLRHYVYVER